MKPTIMTVPLAVLAGALLLAQPAAAKKCKGDAVKVGGVCVDKYEASVWEIAPANAKLIKKLQKSNIGAAADLAGATQRGGTTNDYGISCPDTGNGCTDMYAVSIPGVTPSRYISWFQAQQACLNAGKRLLTSAEWQGAAAGTPDPGTDNGTSDCNISAIMDAVNTGSRNLCVSSRGVFDMVGNLWEWVSDWAEGETGCTNWDAAHGNDISCVGGDGTVHLPGALQRGGGFSNGTGAGVFAVVGGSDLQSGLPFDFGFRCARDL